ncbi:brachyury 2 [Mus musculus]|uniref:Brachyury 2 n=2 Tax=Mus musculus TaxID=10090 RepID=A0A338P791_MOUSE|nr:brachyury 2 [Mus musculus]|eukprot:NP_001155304.1 brachyury 2 [Mus musculus]
MAQILRDHFKTPKKHRGCHTQVEDKEKAAQQTLPEQSQPEAWSASPPKASTRFPSRSNAYLIIGLQNELTKCGILKNMSDDEDFWKLVQEEALGVGTKEKLQKIKLKLMNPRPWPPAASRRRETEMLVSSDQDSGARQGTQDHPGREQEVVEDGPEKERIKQGPHQPGLDPPKHRGDTASLLARLTEWRKRCQQHGAAQRLHRGPEESKTMCKTRTDSQSKMYLSRLYRMYSTSLANMEFSRKLLERDGRFADMDAEHRARSLLDYMVPRERTQADVPPRERTQADVPPRELEEEDSPTPEQQPQAGPALRFLKCQSPESPQRRPHLKTGRHQVTLCGTSKLSEHERGTLAPARRTTDPRPTAPLTLAHVIQTHPVVEAKTASRYWVNNVDEE